MHSFIQPSVFISLEYSFLALLSSRKQIKNLILLLKALAAAFEKKFYYIIDGFLTEKKNLSSALKNECKKIENQKSYYSSFFYLCFVYISSADNLLFSFYFFFEKAANVRNCKSIRLFCSKLLAREKFSCMEIKTFFYCFF